LKRNILANTLTNNQGTKFYLFSEQVLADLHFDGLAVDELARGDHVFEDERRLPAAVDHDVVHLGPMIRFFKWRLDSNTANLCKNLIKTLLYI
jgi:hypothetical protein